MVMVWAWLWLGLLATGLKPVPPVFGLAGFGTPGFRFRFWPDPRLTAGFTGFSKIGQKIDNNFKKFNFCSQKASGMHEILNIN